MSKSSGRGTGSCLLPNKIFGGILVVVGLAFRPVCLVLLIDLIVAAIFTYRLSGNFLDATHAIEDAVMFAGLFFLGAGSYSVDKS
jgi:putative oxidoreductase